MKLKAIWKISDESKAMKTRQIGDITINRILEPAREYGFPAGYIAHLESFLS